MKLKVVLLTTLAAAVLAVSALAVDVASGGEVGSLFVPSQAQAAVTKSVGGGGGEGSVSGAGNRLGDLLSQNGVPVLIAFAGVLLIGALASRNIGASLGIVVITLVGLIFLLAPDSIAAFAKGVANVVF
ncbi:MAG: hypothetical protein WBM00_10160 [Solirubrobacterales bacterium]